MSSYASLYLIDPTWKGDEENIEESVVDEMPHAYEFLQAAPELWRIAGRSDRGKAIDAILDKAYEDQEYPELSLADIDRILSLLEGLDEAIVGPIVDEKYWHLSDEKLAELRQQKFSYIDLKDTDVRRGKSGVGVALGRIHSLRNILRDAKRRNLHIGFPI